MSWIIFSNQSSKPGKRLCANGKSNAPAAQHACGLQNFQRFTNKGSAGFGASRIGGVLQCLGVLLPLMIFGGAQVQAFPNFGVNLKQAIQKQNQALKKGSENEGFKFGILGSVEIKSVGHRFQSNWEGVLERIREETVVYERCSSSAVDCPPKVRQWRKLLQSLKGMPVERQLKILNTSINKMAVYTEDDEIFGKPDYWASPLEFFKGRADCEDYAIIKFWSLLELGYSSDQLRLAVVRDERRKIMHAVVTVDTGDKTIVLDSLFNYPVEEQYVLKYKPIYSANLNSNWVHIVTRKIRVSYINSLKGRATGRIFPVKVKVPAPSVRRPARGAIGLAADQGVRFIDWT